MIIIWEKRMEKNKHQLLIDLSEIIKNNTAEQEVEILKKYFLELRNNNSKDFENFVISYPFDLGNNQAYKPLSIDKFFEIYPQGASLQKYLSSQTDNYNNLFLWNEESGFITDNPDYNFSEIKQNLNAQNSEYELLLERVYLSFENLLKKLPSNLVDIKGFKHSNKYDEYIHNKIPLLYICYSLGENNLLDLLFTKYPQSKQYFDINSDYYQELYGDNLPRSISQLKDKHLSIFEGISRYFTNNSNFSDFSYETSYINEFMYTCLKHKVLNIDEVRKENDLNSAFYSKSIYLAVKHSISIGDTHLLKKIFSQPDLLTVILDKAYKISPEETLSRYYQDYETALLLKQYNIPFFCTTNSGYSMVNTTSVIEKLKTLNSSDTDIKDVDMQDCFPSSILMNPSYYRFYSQFDIFCKVFPEFNSPKILNYYGKMILEATEVDNIEKVFENYNIDISKIDVFSILLNKQADISVYKKSIEYGYDPRVCKSFIEKIISMRDNGLKILRQLNKEGIVSSKNPDYFFHVLNNTTIKSFINYYEKSSDEILNKNTLSGQIAWWGFNNDSTLRSILPRVYDIIQTGKNGENLFYYLINKYNTQNTQNNLKDIIQIITSSKALLPEQSFDISYTNPLNGNHLLHELTKLTVFNKSFSHTQSILKMIELSSLQSLSDFVNIKNHSGLTPLENMFDINNEKENHKNYKLIQLINSFVEYFGEQINYGEISFKGEKIIDLISPYLNEDLQKIVEGYYMKQQSNSSSVVKGKSFKF